MKLSVIIVNYNVKYFLEQALHAVRHASENLAVEVFVVDNNSVDDSVKMVRETFPEVIVIANKDNVGFSIANNQAIEQSKGDYVLLLNPDTVVEEDTFEKVVDFMDKTPNAGGLGVKMIDGSGKFLPESKRGFPSPWVAFCKAFGLSKLFPKSKRFNQYHLGFLDDNKTHEVEVLAGAFMLLRKSVLDEIGLLDETFFMYGEDIDLSYRIIKAGYKNYYFADTTIIHYKGESTKKGSLNYVYVFYNAMIIFAKKHFQGEKAKLYIAFIQLAIYMRALLSLVNRFVQKAFLPIVDASLILLGLFWLKDFWAVTNFNDPNYYKPIFMAFNAPLYTLVWVAGIFFSGGYDFPSQVNRFVKGVFWGSIVLAAIYGFLDLEYRNSRMLLLLGAVWTTLSLWVVRLVRHFLLHKNFLITQSKLRNLIIVGSENESKRVQNLIWKAEIQHNFIGIVAPTTDTSLVDEPLGHIGQLDEISRIYKVNEIIFCSKDISAQTIMKWMTTLGTTTEYKILPEESLSIIGSSSKNTAGQLYTIEVAFKIASPLHRRNKRIFDLLTSIGLLLFSPLLFWWIRRKRGFFPNIFKVLFGRKTWIGYHPTPTIKQTLPAISSGILSPLDELKQTQLDEETLYRLNFLYAKSYAMSRDVEIMMRGWRNVGR